MAGSGTPTANWGISKFASGDAIAPIENLWNAQADDVEAALNKASKGFYLEYQTYALLNAAPTAGLQIGQHATVYNDPTTSNNGDYIWSGSRWLPSGSYQSIVPTAVTGGTIAASGRINFTNSTSVRLDGVFSAAFDNYVIYLNVDSVAGTTHFTGQLSSSGTVNSSQYIQALSGATGSGATTLWTLSNDSVGRTDCKLELFGPALAEYTLGMNATFSTGAPGSVAVSYMGLSHGVASVFDGILFFTNGGVAATGRIRIFGTVK